MQFYRKYSQFYNCHMRAAKQEDARQDDKTTRKKQKTSWKISEKLETMYTSILLCRSVEYKNLLTFLI